MKKLLFLFIIPVFSFGQLTPCQQEVANATGALGEFVPQCEEDGSYSPVQCWYSTGYCWCVDENGVEIPGTAIQEWVGNPDCSITETCDPLYDCGPPLGMPNYFCDDGITVAGPGDCIMNEGGECFWEIIYCPEEIGCTDPLACNFNPDAIPSNFDDGSCLYVGGSCILVVDDYCSCCSGPCDGICPYELLDSLYGENWFCFYDVPDLSYQEGQILVSGFIDENCECITSEIIEEILGCTYETACNYNELATVDDGSCYNNDLGCGCDTPAAAEGYDCDGNCVNDMDGDEVCDEFDNCPENYNPNQEDFNSDYVGDACDGINLDEESIQKKLIKVTDVLGRESTNANFNIKIYDDGGVEKKWVIE